MATKLNTGTRGGSMHSEGVYMLRVEDVEEKTSQNSGNDYLNIRYSVLRNGHPFGPSVWDIIVLNEASEWRKQQLFDSMEAPENLDVDIDWLKGKTVYARIIIDDSYDEDGQNKIKKYVLPKTAMKILANNGVDVEDEKLVATANGTKAAARGRTNKNQPAELATEEAMPL